MALRDRLKELEKTKIRPENFCPYQAMYDKLSDQDKIALDTAWAAGFSANLVLSALRSEGIKSSNEAIRLHFKGLCKCPKK